MRKLKTKWFKRWANKNGLPDFVLNTSLLDLLENKSSVNLGGCLYKLRVSASNRGKSGGFRTLIAYKTDYRVIFLFGFSKNTMGNLERDEIAALKKLAKDLISLDDAEISRQLNLGTLFELEDYDEK